MFAGALATDIGVVHLHVAIETLGAVSLDHDLSELVFIVQAVVCVTPSRRPNSMLEIPFFDWVTRYMALNQSRSGSLLDAKIVPPSPRSACGRRCIGIAGARRA